MDVQADPSRLRRTKWYEYAIRFAFGGVITALAGYLTTTYGPVVGGLFLGFPAILPASLTLVKKHDGEEAAGDDALGAVAGSGGLLAFAVLIWGLSAHLMAVLVLVCAAVAWLALSILLWFAVRRFAAGIQLWPTTAGHAEPQAPAQDDDARSVAAPKR